MSASAQHGVVPLEVLRQHSGLDFLQGIIDGRFPSPPIGATLCFKLLEVEHGRAVFAGAPLAEHYNPIGSVHGGLAATLLDSCISCAVHSTLDAGQGYTTLELKVNFLRPLTVETGPIRAEGRIINRGGRIGLAEGRIVDDAGKLYAHGTNTCMIFPL